MARFNIIVVFLGCFVPALILVIGFDLSAITLIFWPSMMGLMVLGGHIDGTGDIIYIIFLILLNVLVYLCFANVIRVFYKKFQK